MKPNKSVGTVVSSLNALSAIGEVREFLVQRRTLTGIFADEPKVEDRQWLKFYDSPKHLERGCLQAVCGEQSGRIAATIDALRNPVAADDQSKVAAFALIAFLFGKPQASEMPEVVEALLDDDLPDPEAECSIECDNAAISYCVWIHLPCWLVYGVSPTALLRQLAAGDKAAEKAAEKLARLDHRVTVHAKFRRWINADPKIAKYRRKKVQAWVARAPFDKEKSSSHALRVVAGYVSRSSELLGERLEAPEIRDAIQALGNEVPADLQAYLAERTMDDWSREIRRHREHLVKVSNPDKSAIESVRALLRGAR